jgi:hypothetical protein
MAWGRVEYDGRSNFLDISFRDAVALQKVAHGIRTIHFEAKLASSGVFCVRPMSWNMARMY